MARYERWSAVLSAGLIFGALLACKKKQEATSEASASAVVTPPPPPAPVPATATPAETLKLGDVTRYADKEKKSDEAAVRVLTDELKIFNEADAKTPEVATLPKDALVFRLAEVDDFQLVEFPSGIGQFSQGWVEKKALSEQPVKVAREVVLKEQKTATLKVDAGAPKPAGSASAKASASAAPSASAKATASAAPSASAAAESDAERRIREAEERAKAAEKKAKAAEKKAKAAEKKAKEAEKKAK